MFYIYFHCEFVRNQKLLNLVSFQKRANLMLACELGLTSWNMSSLCCPSRGFDLNKLSTGSSFSGLLFITYRVLTLSTLWADCESSCFSWKIMEHLFFMEAESWIVKIGCLMILLLALSYLFLQRCVASNFYLVCRVTLTRSFAGSELYININLWEGKVWTTFRMKGISTFKIFQKLIFKYFHWCSTKCIFECKMAVLDR